MPEENVKVAVRVRPFNSREISRKAELIIGMSGQQTTITDPDKKSAAPKEFSFDYCYWSHDGYAEEKDGYLSPKDSKYADQKKIFDDLGRGVLTNAWKGYNCSLFAYGQTGSGKSYSVVGFGNNKGILPLTCEHLFKEIAEKRKNPDKDNDFVVTMSMLEIYNEQVRDLLTSKNSGKGGLKVREHPTKGFYVETLTVVTVGSYAQIESKINEGTRNRTVAATTMNATSSRAHTIVAINFVQKQKNKEGKKMTKSSIINLVDLAGSERADSSGATGDRLKEGSVINQSLSTLGNCIRALNDISHGKKNINVPFRDSMLTKLLRNALGGNSKTVMIATLSPADINYSETKSTLQFAERAKDVKTVAVVNESSTTKLIRELKEEIERLKKLLSQANSSPDDEDLKKQMEEQMAATKRELDDMETSSDQRNTAAQPDLLVKLEAEKKKEEDRKVIPHFWNLSEDPALTGMLIHFCREGTVKIGNKNAVPAPEIIMNGLSIQKEHASVTNQKGTVTLKSLCSAKIFVNGKALNQNQELHHNDRVLFGPNHLYVFHHPQDEAKQRKAGKPVEQPTYDNAQEELAKELGLITDSSALSKEDLILQDNLIELLPKVNEANAMSLELGKKVKFEICLISPQARGLKEGLTEVMVKMSMENGNWWLLNRNTFIDKKYLMEEMYQNYIQGDPNWDVSKEKDPFWQSHKTPVLIGTAHIYLKSVSHLIDMDDSLIIMDFKGKEAGHLLIELIPCDAKWNALKSEYFLDDPNELMGRPLYLKFKIKGARGIPANFYTTNCSYKFYLEDKLTKTKEIKGTINPDYTHDRQISFNSVTQQLLDYLNKESVTVEVWGQQKEESVRPKTANSNTPRLTKKSAKLKADIQKDLDLATSKGMNSISIDVIQARLAELTGSDPSASDGKKSGNEKRSETCSLQ